MVRVVLRGRRSRSLAAASSQQPRSGRLTSSRGLIFDGASSAEQPLQAASQPTAAQPSQPPQPHCSIAPRTLRALSASQQPRSGRLTSSRGLIFDGASSAEQPLQAASQPTAAQPSQPPQPHCSIAPRTLRALSQCTVPLRAPRSVPRFAPSSVLTLSHTLSFGVCSACPPACCTRSVSRAVPRVVLWLSVALSLVLSLALSCVSVALCPPLHPRRAVPLASRVRARSVRSPRTLCPPLMPLPFAITCVPFKWPRCLSVERLPGAEGSKKKTQKAYQKSGSGATQVGG